jgi:two-component system chemotaxis sensor kinase CheA
MSLDAVLQTFYVEAHEHLEAMENILLKMDAGEYNDEMLNDIFRSAHTIKGSASIFGLDHIVNFTHVIENVLDRVRDNNVEIDKSLINIIFKCRDHIQNLVGTTLDEYNSQADLQKTDDDLLEALTPWASERCNRKEQQINNDTENQSQHTKHNDESLGGYWHISLRLSIDCLRNGMDPLSFIKFLTRIGDIKHIETIIDNFPSVNNFDAENLYFAYEISFQSDASLEAIENTFMFVQEDSDITILPPNASPDDYLALIDKLPEDNQKIGDILVNCGSLSKQALEQILSSKIKEATTKKTSYKKQAKLITESNKTADILTDRALSKPNKSNNKGVEGKQIRVDSNRLDNLINLIGELVINQQRIDLLSKNIKSSALVEAVDDFDNFTNQIRDAALSLRMVPIGGTFQRFNRLVRDTAQELKKEIELTIDGAETELDRLMVEKLGDPLTHIVRNAMDHGIESIDTRKALGKNSKGQLRISANHEASHIVISISDDGSGIDKVRVREKAIEKGIINSDSQLSDNELYHLIFHPGFSTAETVTNLSGRGVGMDVVKRNIEALQGTIEINSQPGAGSEFKIRLPLTLAIIEGFHVEAKGTNFIIPQTTILECIDLTHYQEIEARHCINLRGEMIPYLNMSEIFKLTQNQDPLLIDKVKPQSHRRELVIVQFGSDVAGIAVDALHGEIQTVVKPLGPIFKGLKGIGGSSLLGNGEIAFILDIPELVELAVGDEVKSNACNAKHKHIKK